jgi:hypothetical protein
MKAFSINAVSVMTLSVIALSVTMLSLIKIQNKDHQYNENETQHYKNLNQVTLHNINLNIDNQHS